MVGIDVPARDVNVPFGIRTAIVGMYSNESGIENSRMFIGAPPTFVRQGRDGLDALQPLCLCTALDRRKAPVSQV
jgi:hypothetical protein